MEKRDREKEKTIFRKLTRAALLEEVDTLEIVEQGF
jgi:hypothetical protein